MKQYSVSIPNVASDVHVMGRVTRDVEMRFTPAGTEVSNVQLAVSRRWKPQDSEEWQEQTAFFQMAVWGEAAKRVANIHKGDIVNASFSLADLKAETYANAAGETKTSLKVSRATISRIAWTDGEVADETPEAQDAPAEEAPVQEPIQF